jgi:hypothetical protein
LITGFFDLAAPWPIPAVTLTLYVPGLSRVGRTVSLLIDSGAARSCIHPFVATRALGIDPATLADPRHWSRHVTHQGVGGTNLYYREPAYYLFRHDDGSWQPLDGEIDVAQARPDNQTLASVLGWDVLQHFRVVVDWPSRQVTLG